MACFQNPGSVFTLTIMGLSWSGIIFRLLSISVHTDCEFNLLLRYGANSTVTPFAGTFSRRGFLHAIVTDIRIHFSDFSDRSPEITAVSSYTSPSRRIHNPMKMLTILCTLKYVLPSANTYLRRIHQ